MGRGKEGEGWKKRGGEDRDIDGGDGYEGKVWEDNGWIESERGSRS